MFSERQSLLETLHRELIKGRQGQCIDIDIDPDYDENSMAAANRATPIFFRQGGILDKLLAKHPSFASKDPRLVEMYS